MKKIILLFLLFTIISCSSKKNNILEFIENGFEENTYLSISINTKDDLKSSIKIINHKIKANTEYIFAIGRNEGPIRFTYQATNDGEFFVNANELSLGDDSFIDTLKKANYMSIGIYQSEHYTDYYELKGLQDFLSKNSL